MLEIKIDLVPFGIESERKNLVTGRIYNDGSGTNNRGNYVVELKGSRGKLWRKGEVKDYPRNSYSVWVLLYRALKSIFK